MSSVRTHGEEQRDYEESAIDTKVRREECSMNDQKIVDLDGELAVLEERLDDCQMRLAGVSESFTNLEGAECRVGISLESAEANEDKIHVSKDAMYAMTASGTERCQPDDVTASNVKTEGATVADPMDHAVKDANEILVEQDSMMGCIRPLFYAQRKVVTVQFVVVETFDDD